MYYLSEVHFYERTHPKVREALLKLQIDPSNGMPRFKYGLLSQSEARSFHLLLEQPGATP